MVNTITNEDGREIMGVVYYDYPALGRMERVEYESADEMVAGFAENVDAGCEIFDIRVFTSDEAAVERMDAVAEAAGKSPVIHWWNLGDNLRPLG